MKKIIGILILILLIAAIVLSCIIIKNGGKNILSNSQEGKSDPIITQNKYTIIYPDNRSNYFTVSNITKEYINYVVGEEKTKLINILSEKYVNENDVTENNILNFVKDLAITYSQNYDTIINTVYVARESNTIETYFITLTYCNLDNNLNYKMELMVQLDQANSTFQVLPSEYMKSQGYSNINIGDTCDTKTTRIENKTYNTYSLIPISKNSMPERYFNIYYSYLQYDQESAYNLLEQEYRNARFGNIEKYKEYINSIDLETRFLKGYQINEHDGYIQYVCIDNNGNYYIFNETGIMQYTVMLDAYTIDLPEFLEKYNNGTAQQKVALNIEKFVQAINDKSYNYAYNCLADSFKNNYFRTQEEFETYVKSNFYESNSITYNSFETQGELYTYSVTITNKETNEQKTKTFIMQLGEGTEFVLSFDR